MILDQGCSQPPGLMSSDSELVRGDVKVEERLDIDMFCIFSGSFEAEVSEVAESAEVEPKLSLFPLLFLLNFVGLMKSAIG